MRCVFRDDDTQPESRTTTALIRPSRGLDGRSSPEETPRVQPKHEHCQALWVAAAEGNITAVKRLVQNSTLIDAGSELRGTTALHKACMYSRHAIVQLLCTMHGLKRHCNSLDKRGPSLE